MNTPTYITIVSTHGVIRVDRQTGQVIGRRINDEVKVAHQYHTAYHFDLDDYFAWDKGSDRVTCEHIDILGINYTYINRDGKRIVENSAKGWRKEVEEMRKDGQVEALQEQESHVDSAVHEMLEMVIPNDELFTQYYAFRDALQKSIQAMHPDADFGNF